MNDKEFEQWLIREKAILKVSKEVDDWNENDVFVDELYKRYHQLEKDKDELAFNSLDVIKKLQEANAELLAVIKDIRDIAELNEHWSISRIKELSAEAYTKH